MTLEQLLAAMKSCHGEMKTYLAKSKAAESDEDRQKFKVLYEAKREEFDDLKLQAEEAKALNTQQAEIDALEEESSANVQSKSFTGGKTKAVGGSATGDGEGSKSTSTSTATLTRGRHSLPEEDPRHKTIFEVDCSDERQEYHHRSVLLTFAKAGPARLTGEQLSAFSCKDPRITGKDEEESDLYMVLPKSMARNIRKQGKADVCIDYYGSKVMLSTDIVGTTTDSGLANLVAPDFRPQLLQKPVWYPDLYDLVRLIPAVNGHAEWPMLDQSQGKHGGVAFTWKGTEGADKGSTEGVFKDFVLTTAELSGWTEVSLRALRRPALDLEALLTQLYRDAVRYEFSRVILEGDGSGSPMAQPMGILNTAGVTTVARQTANQVGWVDLTNLEYSIQQASRSNGRFVLHDNVEKYIKQRVDSDARPIFTADVHSQIRTQLAGYGYTAHDHDNGATLDLGVEGDVIFGDWNNYGWAMEEDIMIARSDHAAFKQGRVVFRLMVFVGGKAIYPELFSLLTDAV